MSSTNASARRDAASATVQQLRLRLLDLTARNPLISFDHGSRALSRANVRAIDAGIDGFYSRLIEPGKPIPLRPLPPMPKGPGDEATPAFESALELARQVDRDYAAAMDELSPEEAATAKAAKMERKLRDRVREQLRMPPAGEVAAQSVADHARRHGIDPSFDLPATSTKLTEAGRQRPFEIQTLLDQEQLDRRLSKIRESARLYAEETGVSALYTAWGFLEWFEADSSERPLTSPILLLRTDLERTVQRARFQYVVEEAGEDVQVNLTLAERLKRDFQIALPDIQEEELPSAFLERVEREVCKDKPRWRVRRFVTLALLPFARLAMFNDLDEENWSSVGGLPDHPVVGELLGGNEAGGAMFAAEHDVDSGPVRSAVPTMVMEADASQHSAVYDAITGKNLVIEGPPGTGKSQTITNLIAAALDAGKKVLFVADKQTALQVVKDRLDSVGLGDFCLEIHSGKARKKDVVDALAQRLSRRPTPPVRGLETRRADVASIKRDLNTYADTLNRSFGAEGRSVHDIIWADRRRREVESEQARRLDGLKLPGADRMTEADLERLKAFATRYERAAGQVLAVAARPGDHPWYGVGRSSLPSTDIEIAYRDVGDLADHLAALLALAVALPAPVSLPGEPTVSDIRTAVGPVIGISITTRHPARWHEALLEGARRAEAAEWLRHVRAFREAADAVERHGLEPDRLPDRPSLEAVLALRSELDHGVPGTLTTATVGGYVEELRREAEAMERLVAATAQCLSAFGTRRKATVGDVATVIRLVDLIAGLDERVLSAVSPVLLDRQAPDAVAAASERLDKLRARQVELEKDHDLGKAPAAEVLRRHADALRSAGIFGFMSGPVKEAQGAYAAIRRNPSKVSKQQAVDGLSALADHLATIDLLQADGELKALFGRRWKGLDTDDRLAAECASFGKSLRSSLVGYDEVTLELRRILTDADEDRLRAIAALHERVITSGLREQVVALAPGTAVDAELALVLVERGRTVTRYAEAANAAGLPNELGFARHEEIGRVLLSALEAERRAACPAGLADALGTGVPGMRHDDLSLLEEAIAAVEVLDAMNVTPALKVALSRLSPNALMEEVVPAARAAEQAAERAVTLWDAVRERLQVNPAAFFGAPFLGLPLGHLEQRCRRATTHRDELGAWTGYLLERHDAIARGLGELLDLWDEGLVTGELPGLVERTFWRSLTREAFESYPELNRFSGFNQEQTKQQFRDLDRQLVRLGREDIVAKLLNRPVPAGNGEGKRSDYTDLALIHNEIAKKTKHIAIRSLLDRAGAAAQALKPCFMMSPLSVAQYMKPGALRFDLLVIDEASQMRPEDAVGAIARCDRIVVVGDPKQLPPTAFFDKNEVTADEEEADETIDAESILDQAMARFRPARRLRWHYRSRHGSLIAFSNREFYDNDLIVFPSPRDVSPDVGVSLEKVEGLYLARSNVAEAMAVCRAAARHMRERPDRSLGVATLNTVQRQLIIEEMERLSTTDPDVEAYMTRWNATLERFFVKNLENVQGDERDTIFVSTVFGPSDAGGPVRQNFGPINKPGGERRLNVLFTRAKHQLRVFTSMTPDQITANPDSPRGARVLRGFLTFAATGRLEGGEETGRPPDSDFEVFVAERLRLAGYESAMQVGVAGFFLDIAVRDPSRPGVFLCGVECDGASYHSSKSARDRDILRQQVLEGLGWNIYRIWSTDWFRDPNGQTAKLLEHLARLRSSPQGAAPSKVFA